MASSSLYKELFAFKVEKRKQIIFLGIFGIFLCIIKWIRATLNTYFYHNTNKSQPPMIWITEKVEQPFWLVSRNLCRPMRSEFRNMVSLRICRPMRSKEVEEYISFYTTAILFNIAWHHIKLIFVHVHSSMFIQILRFFYFIPLLVLNTFANYI